MAVPTVNGVIGTKGTTASGTSCIITLSAGSAIGTVVIVFLAHTGTNLPSSIVDSGGNTYVSMGYVSGSTPSYALYAALITTALISTNTITITLNGTEQGAAAVAISLSGISKSQIVANGYGATSTNKTGSSSASTNNACSSTLIADSIYLAFFGTYNAAGQVLNSDFTSGSVGSSFVNETSVVSSGGTAGCGACLCYLTVSATTPMPSESPTFTLNTSRAFNNVLFQLAGLTARGAVGANTRCGWPPASGTANYAPKPGGGTHSNYHQVGKTLFDGWPKPVITPGPRAEGIQVSDGLLVAD